MSLTNFDQDHSRTSLENCSNEVNSTVATPEEFVTKYGGKRVIKKILIANNGIAGTQTFLGFPIRKGTLITYMTSLTILAGSILY